MILTTLQTEHNYSLRSECNNTRLSNRVMNDDVRAPITTELTTAQLFAKLNIQYTLTIKTLQPLFKQNELTA